MRSLTPDALGVLLAAHEPPCVSLYQPTARAYPDRQQGPVDYKNLLREAEESLRQKYAGRETRALLERLHALTDDNLFWARRLEGLAVFGAKDVFEVFDLQRPVPRRVVVADSFHLKPLLRVGRTADRFQVLCLTRGRARLLEGTRDGLDEVDLAGVPATVEEALGEGQTGDRPELAPGGTGEARPGPQNVPAGHGRKGEAAKVDAERFFRLVDQGVLEKHSRPSGLPLVLAALADNQALFRSLSRNPQLLPEGVEHNPDAATVDQLREAAWKAVEPRHSERLARLTEDYGTAKARGQATDDLAQAAEAALAGRVGTLLVDADRQLPGTLDPATGRPRPADGSRPDVDDMLDDLGEVVLRARGTVLVLPADRMPTATGLAAVYRY